MRTLSLLLILMSCNIIIAQNDSNNVDIKSIDISTSTALGLLDSPSSIVTSNSTVKEFSVTTENFSMVSFEGTLFLNKKGRDLKGLEYFGLGKNVNEIKAITFDKLLRPTLSGALNQTDTLTKISVGINFNLFTVYSTSTQKMKDSYLALKKDVNTLATMADEALLKAGKKISDNNYATLKVAEMNKIEMEMPDAFSNSLKKPLLSLDIAGAYSQVFPNNDFHNDKDRFGAWSTLTVSQNLSKKRKSEDYINAYVFSRYLNDNAVYNEDDNVYESMNYFDFGGKLQLDLGKLSIGYEYIKRNQGKDNYRSVGVLQYKINSDVYITGGFGKNFNATFDKELVTLFGIRWGLNKKDLLSWE